MGTLNISLPDGVHAAVDEQVTTGRFPSQSEYIRTLIRDDQKRVAREKLEALLLSRLDGPTTDFTPEDWQNMREELLLRAAEGKGQ